MNKKSKVCLRPLRAFLTHWYPPFVVTPLHSVFAQFSVKSKTYHYAYPVVVQRSLKVEIPQISVTLKEEIINQYQYYRAIILLNNGDYERAFEAFALALNAPFGASSLVLRIPWTHLQSYYYFRMLAILLGKKVTISYSRTPAKS